MKTRCMVCCSPLANTSEAHNVFCSVKCEKYWKGRQMEKRLDGIIDGGIKDRYMESDTLWYIADNAGYDKWRPEDAVPDGLLSEDNPKPGDTWLDMIRFYRKEYVK